jgi:acetyl esterase/lipase
MPGSDGRGRAGPSPVDDSSVLRYPYGPDASQYGELHLPAVRRFAGVAVVLHGGYWRSRYGAELGTPLAQDLAGHGIPAWNLEYRRAGNGGGWPETFDDVAAGIDLLARLAGRHDLRLDRVTALGHSAGGHLAVWAAGRSQLPVGSPGRASALAPLVPLTAVVSQSGLLDLRQARLQNLSDGAVLNLLGSSPEEDPSRYLLADPMHLAPLPVPVYAVVGRNDSTVPPQLSRAYVTVCNATAIHGFARPMADPARPAPAPARLVEVPGDHFDLIDPTSEAYAVCRALVAESLLPLPWPEQGRDIPAARP